MEQSILFLAGSILMGLGALGAAVGIGIPVSYTHLTLPTNREV